MTPQSVINYWFDGCEDDPSRLQARGRFWYGADPVVDAELRAEFGDLHAAAVRGDLDHWAGQSEGRLALILLLDQFSRNLFRGQAGAFAQDGRAQQLCTQGMQLGLDVALHPVHASFFYMPLEHAEDRALQAQSVACFTALLEQAQPEFREYFEGALKWAREHADVVQRFGRFPHRNVVLGRDSTPEELRYLKSEGSSYGQ